MRFATSELDNLTLYRMAMGHLPSVLLRMHFLGLLILPVQLSNSYIVVVDTSAEHLLRVILPDHILIEILLQC